MKIKNINIGIVGIGQIGSRLYKEIISKKKILNLKQVKMSISLLYQQKVLVKKDLSPLIKKFFLKIL